MSTNNFKNANASLIYSLSPDLSEENIRAYDPDLTSEWEVRDHIIDEFNKAKN